MVKHRTFPWPDSSNIKYPLVATAPCNLLLGISFPVPNDGMVVKARVVGKIRMVLVQTVLVVSPSI